VKELDVYASDRVPDDYSLASEIDALDRLAAERGYDRFHLYGYSIGRLDRAGLRCCDASTAGSCKGPPPDCRRIVIRLRYGIKARSDRRATSTGRRRLVNVHANRPLTPSLRRIDRQQSVRWGEGATRKDQASRSGRPVATESARPPAPRNRCRAWRQRTEQQTASRRALAGMGFWHHAHSLVTPGHRLS